jgi:hypothetical protein
MRNIFKTAIIFGLILLTSGCSKKYLDPVPQTALSDLSVFDNKDRILAQVNGMYARMKSGDFLGGRYFVYNDVRDDNFIPKSSNLVTAFATWNHSVVSSTNEVQNLWGAVYQAINTINVFNDNLETNWTDGKLDGIITESEKNQYKSEALTLRALSYFCLLQLYAKPYNIGAGANPGLPLRLKGMKSAEENDLARSTVAEVYTQILDDLNTAETLAISDYGDDLLNTTRVHKNTIIALKTRVYMHMQNWSSVISEAQKITSGSAPYTAPSGVANALDASYAGIFETPYTSSESIFSMPFTATDQPGSQNSLPWYYAPPSSESYYLVTATGSTYDKMDATDARKLMMVESGGQVFLGKFPDITTQANYAPVIRYAEVLLNYSEAIVREGGAVTQTAIDLLNAVRTRSFPAGAYTPASFATVQDFYDAILLERTMEFLGEGIRNLDLMRLGLTIPGKDGGAQGVVPAIPSNSTNYIWPIPNSELSQNKLMTPNE